MSEKPSIDASSNGPFMVKNLNKLTKSNNDELETKPVMALCRCGSSNTKPFCDGTHTKIGFDDRRERKEEYAINEFKGKDITVVDDIGVCSHAGACVRGAPKTFFSWEGEKRISTPDKEIKEEIIETIRKCPSGSLTYKIDGKLYDEYFSEPEIFISKDGPLYVRGGLVFSDPRGAKSHSKDHNTLCRCGSSKTKPFCDGTHKKVGFTDDKN